MGHFIGRKNSVMENAALLCLCTLFFFLAIGTVVMGVSAYQGVSRIVEENSGCRTALAYITNQVRRADSGGGITGESFQGIDALVLSEDMDGSRYLTYIYCYNNFLMELFVEQGTALEAEAGSQLLPLSDMTVEVTADGLIHVMVRDESGVEGSVLLSPRSSALDFITLVD